MAEKLKGKIPTGKCNPVSEDNKVLNCDGAKLVHVVQIKVNKQCKEHSSSTTFIDQLTKYVFYKSIRHLCHALKFIMQSDKGYLLRGVLQLGLPVQRLLSNGVEKDNTFVYEMRSLPMRVTRRGSEAEKRHRVMGRTVLGRDKCYQGVIICCCHSILLISFLTNMSGHYSRCY